MSIKKPVPDIVWGQLRRIERILHNELKNLRFNVIYVDSWVNKDFTYAITLVEIADCSKEYEIHVGPLAYDLDNAIRFLIKNRDSLAGPWIENSGRLYCIRRRRYRDIDSVLKNVTEKIRSFSALSIANVVKSVNDLPQDHELRLWIYRFVFRKVFDRVLKLLI